MATAPPEAVLTRLLETLYFASLKTDEGRPILCTVNYVDPAQRQNVGSGQATADCWSHVPFDRPLPFDVRTLTKLARAADPAVSSLAVFRDKKNKLFIWGMVDQEPRHSDYIMLDAASTPARPGLFQATITGVGNISVYQNDALIGSLEQNTLVEEYHDVLWAGPVHDLLAGLSATATWSKRPSTLPSTSQRPTCEGELLLRWLNSICRILMNIQHYRHGGGLLITPQTTLDGLNVKYKIRYDRLLRSLRGMVESQFLSAEPAMAAVRSPIDRAHIKLPTSVPARRDESADATATATSIRTKCWERSASLPRSRASMASCCWTAAWSCTASASRCAPTTC